MKETLLNLMRVTGAFAPFRLANRHKALILTYHRFSFEESEFATSARAFAEQLEYLRAHYSIVSLSALAECLEAGRSLLPSAVAITIDDGYGDAYEVALPVLRRYGAPATLFVVTGFLDREAWIWTDKMRFITTRTNEKFIEASIDSRPLRIGLGGKRSRLMAADSVNSALKAMPEDERDEMIARIARSLSVIVPETPPAEFAPMSWQQAREMDSLGVEIGSHTVTHPVLTHSSASRLGRELGESRSRLEAVLGRSVDLFCYPNGDYDQAVRKEVARAGYRCAVTTEAGLNDGRGDPLALKRIHTERDLAHFAQATSGLEQIKEKLRRAAPRTASAHS